MLKKLPPFSLLQRALKNLQSMCKFQLYIYKFKFIFSLKTMRYRKKYIYITMCLPRRMNLLISVHIFQKAAGFDDKTQNT